jgi:caffeoyl-CoA O-methyltransferase
MVAGLPDDGRLITCDIDGETTVIAKSFWARSAHGRKIESRLGPALETIKALPADTLFDFMFLDADKENYVSYYEALLPQLRTGGLLAADNVLCGRARCSIPRKNPITPSWRSIRTSRALNTCCCLCVTA